MTNTAENTIDTPTGIDANAAPETATNAATSDRQQAIAAARESFSGKTLTESQFKEALAISGIINREIHKSGSFREKLTDYSHAYSRSAKFDAMRGESTIRDIYTATYGETMNNARETLLERENALTASPEVQSQTQVQALRSAEAIGPMIQQGQTQPFYKAYDQAATELSQTLKITQSGAKALMKDAYKAAHGRDLYEASKEVEDAYHKPVREAEIAARKAEKLETESQTRSQNRSMA